MARPKTINVSPAQLTAIEAQLNAGATQTEIAAWLGISQGSVSRIVREHFELRLKGRK